MNKLKQLFHYYHENKKGTVIDYNKYSVEFELNSENSMPANA